MTYKILFWVYLYDNMNNTHEFIHTNEQSKCRICWETGGKLLSPCKCSGSSKFVHEQCLQKWFQKGVQQNMLSVRQLQSNYSCIPCQICKGQITFKGKKKTGCLPQSQIHHRICENVPQFILYLVVLAILIYRLIENIEFAQDMIAGHIILSILILVALICYVKLFIPLLGQYFWGDQVLEIEFMNTDNKYDHHQQIQMDEITDMHH